MRDQQFLLWQWLRYCAAQTCAALSLLIVQPGWAQLIPNDQEAPTEIEAEALSHDELNGITIATGNVIVTKGSILLKGVRVEVLQDALGYQTVIADGTTREPAYFHQKRDNEAATNIEADVEAYGEKIIYDSNVEEVQLVGGAIFRRVLNGKLQDEAKGKHIVYNNILDTYCVESSFGQCNAHSQPQSAQKKDSEAPPQGKKRVRVIIGPRS